MQWRRSDASPDLSLQDAPDDLAGGKVLSGGLVGNLSKLPDQLLEDRTHLRVRDSIRMEVDAAYYTGEMQI